MIAGIFYQSSGLGNQLFRYVTTRVLAEDKGYEWGMLYYANDQTKDPYFKGSSFMKGDFIGKNPVSKGWPHGFTNFTEKKVVENGIDIRGYDPEINFVQDNTIIDGEFQDERYWGHRLDDIDKWLEVVPMIFTNDVCVIGFRGGEYSVFPDLFLTRAYWDDAIDLMRTKNPNMKFEVHTDDPELAKKFFDNRYPVIHDIGLNWRSMRYAEHAIIANSSFYILPRLLNGGTTIAPRCWARHNIGVWALPQNYYKKFTYI